ASGNVKANGELTNNGTLTGADVDATTLTNNSELIASGDVTAASINNSGDKFIANGDVTAASINNSGDEFIVKGNVKTGALTNSGIADVGTLTMSDNSTITANGGSLTADTITANNSNIIANGGKVDAGTITADELAINTTGNAQEQVVIDTLVGDGLTLNVDTLEKNQVVIGNYTGESVSVIGSRGVTDNLGNDLTSIEAGMQDLADTLNIKSDGAVKELVAEEGSVLGTITGTVDANGNLTVTGEDVNSFNQGVSEMASIALMTWRQENNDMNKRLGELRDSAGEHGVWVRMTRGESKYGAQNIKNQYNAYQLGYDEKLSVDKNWTVGAALTYTDANSSFSGGKGENKHKGIALYGSRLNDDGSFIDLIARYARLEHDFDVRGGAGKGDFDTNGYSLSAEYGKRFTGKSGLWLEPQVELTYGRVSSANYVTDRGVMVRQDDMDSLVGRLGFALGQNLSKGKGNVYLRASYLYDFEGETDARFMNATQQQRGFEQDLGGGWWEVGVGANINLSEATHLYFDVEKTYGGNVATPWQWNAGVRW
ncbi:autotransporter outer membrane beta-barrel domain-containing protein, partial [uncultured Phascolarctobacterium sp.]|uniref:autotransporter outer membrane beta-barrel domain-containing protein n=1 Tax=uncultured Phascolarctobacterium sp. TaxID=512296 RepID=UPI0025EFDA5D